MIYKRTLVKGVTWEVSGFILLIIVGWVLTGDLLGMSLTAALYSMLRILMFYGHERLWKKIKWGKGDYK